MFVFFVSVFVCLLWNGRSDVQTQKLHQCVRHELRNGLLGKLFLLLY